MKKHNERCKDCKTRIFELLSQIYGEVYQNYNLDFPNKLADFKPNEVNASLKEILSELQNYRGHTTFIRAKKLPNVDYFVKNPGFILEFDESQHFTKPRNIALNKYPDNLKLGFDKSKWENLSTKLDKKDNDPPFRDEQRAWYDTLRDFAPVFLDIKPTIRLFASDFVWCSLNPNNDHDIELFKNLLK